MRRLLLLGLLALALPNAQAQSDTAPGFRETLRAHLDAVQRHDLDALLPTLTTRDSLVLIFPNGTLVRTRQDFVDIHTEWFADTTWTMETEVLDVIASPEMAVATVRYTLRDDTPRSGRQALLSLVFRKKAGAWRLVHDQNTALPMPEGGE